MMDGPLLWYLNRSSGFVILALFTLATVLGVAATQGKAGRRVPRFVTQSLHRNVALLSVMMLMVHIVTAVADTFVDIRWWQALVPYVGSTYQPLWLGLGTLALDLTLVITVTSLLRTRLRHRTWRGIHVLAYAGWVLSIGHTLGIGTDIREGSAWATGFTAACVASVLMATVYRLGRLAQGRPTTPAVTS